MSKAVNIHTARFNGKLKFLFIDGRVELLSGIWLFLTYIPNGLSLK